jgi:hypothetical protein
VQKLFGSVEEKETGETVVKTRWDKRREFSTREDDVELLNQSVLGEFFEDEFPSVPIADLGKVGSGVRIKIFAVFRAVRCESLIEIQYRNG